VITAHRDPHYYAGAFWGGKKGGPVNGQKVDDAAGTKVFVPKRVGQYTGLKGNSLAEGRGLNNTIQPDHWRARWNG